MSTKGDDLEHDGEQVSHLKPTALKVLATLLEHAFQHGCQTITRNELIGRIWPTVSVGPTNLDVHIGKIRKLLDERGLQAIHRRGY